MKSIDIIKMPNYKKLSDLMYDVASLGLVVCSTLSCEQAFELLKEIVSCNNIQLGSIYLQDEDYNGYDREYYVTLDSDMVLDISPAWHKGDETHSAGYAYNEADVYFFDGDSRAAIMREYQDKVCYELRFYDVNENKQLHNIKEILDDNILKLLF